MPQLWLTTPLAPPQVTKPGSQDRLDDDAFAQLALSDLVGLRSRLTTVNLECCTKVGVRARGGGNERPGVTYAWGRRVGAGGRRAPGRHLGVSMVVEPPRRPGPQTPPPVLAHCSQLTLAGLAALVLTLSLCPGLITPPLYLHTADPGRTRGAGASLPTYQDLDAAQGARWREKRGRGNEG